MPVKQSALGKVVVGVLSLVFAWGGTSVQAQPTGESLPMPVIKIPKAPMIPPVEEITRDGFVIDMSRPLPGTDLPLALGEDPGKKDNASIITNVIDHLDKLAPQASIVILRFPAGRIMVDKPIYLGDHGKRVVVLRGQGMGKTQIVNPSDDFADGQLFNSGCPGARVCLFGSPDPAQIPVPTSRPMVARQGTVAIAAGADTLWVSQSDYAAAVVGEGLWLFSDDYYGPDNKRYKPAYGEAIYLKDKRVVDGHYELIFATPVQETYYVGRGARPPYGYHNYDGAIWVRGADRAYAFGPWKGIRTAFPGRFYAFEDMTMVCGTKPGGAATTGSIPMDSRYTRCEFIASFSPAPYSNTATRVLFEDCVMRSGSRGPELSFFCRDVYVKNCTLMPMQGSAAAQRAPWWSIQECSTDCLIDGLTVQANEDGQAWVPGGNIIKFTGKRSGFINSHLNFGDMKSNYTFITVLKQKSDGWPNGNQFFRVEDNYFINNHVTIGAGAAEGSAMFRLVDAATNFTAAGNTFVIRSARGVARFVSADQFTRDVTIADNVYQGKPAPNEVAADAAGVRLLRNSDAVMYLAKPNPAVEVVPGAPRPGPWQSLSAK